MKKLEVFSKKAGRTVTVKSAAACNPVVGWSNGGWSKSGGWKKPAL